MTTQPVQVDDYDREGGKNRYLVIAVFAILIWILLITRLVSLQLVQGAHFEKMSRVQKLRTINLKPVRGDILDRNGHPMARTIQGFELVLYADPALRTITDLAGSISELVDIPREEIEKGFEERHRVADFQPTIVIEDLRRSQVAALEENLTDRKGLEVVSVPKRVYPRGKVGSHLIGYLGEVTGKELDPDPDRETVYRHGNLIGRLGIEEQWEHLLRGTAGKQTVVVDSTGRRNELFEKALSLAPPESTKPGKTVQLTIDANLQKACEIILGETAGAAVVMDVNNGEILALASTPGFDPNMMMGKLDPEQWKTMVDDPRKPFFYRPIQGEYPPGSVFKVVVAAAAMQEKVLEPTDNIRCKGAVELGANLDRYHCWNHDGHGYVDFYNGLVQSCDIYFYRLGELLGIDTIQNYAYKFGLGFHTKIGFPGEKRGLVPGPIWKRRFIGKSWYLGDTVITAIGQGYTLMSPLQVTRMMSVIANGGKLLRPRLVRRVLDWEGNVVEDFIPEVEEFEVISPEVCRMITRALVGVVHDPRGTGYNTMGTLKVKVAGKTGTAQVIARSRKAIFMEEKGEIPWKYRDQAWFTAFVPAHNPRVAITVLVEHGGGGSVAAAPLCGKIIDYYIDNIYRQARK